jgi:cell division initiation protein
MAMRITPLDIRQKTFEKNFRGYEKDEVNAFLLTLSQEWERILDENRELRLKLEGTEREVTKLREVENSLYKTLKTAEDTGANVIDQARTAANLHLRESQIQADGLLQEAKSKARDTIEESDSRAKEILAEMEERLKLLIENYKMIEASREDLLANFKHIASDALDRVERSRNLTRDFDPDKHLAMVKREARRVAFPNSVDISKSVRNEPVQKRDKEVVMEEAPVAVEQPAKKVQSFFDEIG